jgi:hypothetical protein
LLIALRMTRTRDAKQEATQQDRAREATQRAFDRYLRVRPADIGTIDALRGYLVGAVRSELSHMNDEQVARREHEAASWVESSAVGDSTVRSAEVIHIEVAIAERRRKRAASAIKRIREDLSGDRIALGTIDCIEKGKTEPAEQARLLGCSVEEIHAARKRRKRALEKILAAQAAEDEEKT